MSSSASSTVARDLGKTPDEIRSLNFIKPEKMPYTTATGKVYDTGEFKGTCAAPWRSPNGTRFRQRLAEARRRGRIRGIGMASYIEACSADRPRTRKSASRRTGR